MMVIATIPVMRMRIICILMLVIDHRGEHVGLHALLQRLPLDLALDAHGHVL